MMNLLIAAMDELHIGYLWEIGTSVVSEDTARGSPGSGSHILPLVSQGKRICLQKEGHYFLGKERM